MSHRGPPGGAGGLWQTQGRSRSPYISIPMPLASPILSKRATGRLGASRCIRDRCLRLRARGCPGVFVGRDIGHFEEECTNLIGCCPLKAKLESGQGNFTLEGPPPCWIDCCMSCPCRDPFEFHINREGGGLHFAHSTATVSALNTPHPLICLSMARPVSFATTACTRRATSVCRLRHDRMGQGPTEPHAARSTFLLSSGGAGGGYY